jgi:Tetratricopeptide repeat
MRLEDAERTCRQVLVMLQDQPVSAERGTRIAAVSHNLGEIARMQGRLEGAEDWYRKSLTIREGLGNQADTAANYQQLGVIAHMRGRLDAEDWSRKSRIDREDDD